MTAKTKIKSVPNTNLISCVIRLDDGTKTHIVGLTKTGYKVEGRSKQVPMKHVRAMKNTLVEDTTDKEFAIVDGMRVNINKKQAAGEQEIESPSLDTVRRVLDPADAPKSKKEKAAPKSKKEKAATTEDLERRIVYLEKALTKLLPREDQPKEEHDKGPHYKFLQPSVITKSYKEKLSMPPAAKKIMAKELSLEPKQIKRGLLVNDRRNGLITFLGYNKDELKFVFFDAKQNIVALPADAVDAAHFTMASDIELDRP